jgi:hypothetical protein
MLGPQAEIETRLDRGEPLALVEAEVIGPCLLPEDAKAALWPYAWCLLDNTERAAASASRD